MDVRTPKSMASGRPSAAAPPDPPKVLVVTTFSSDDFVFGAL